MILSRKTMRVLCRKHKLVSRRDGQELKIEPASIDVHLAEILIDKDTVCAGVVILEPGQFCLGSLVETFIMPDDLVGFVEGKSTLAREGLQIHAAGLIDPGFRGDIVLELKNLHHKESIDLVIGEPIGQVYFQLLDQPVDVPYGPGNHYQDQRGVTPSYRKVA